MYSRASNYTKSIRILITPNCNYNCIFCHNEGVNKYDKNIVSETDMEKM